MVILKRNIIIIASLILLFAAGAFVLNNYNKNLEKSKIEQAKKQEDKKQTEDKKQEDKKEEEKKEEAVMAPNFTLEDLKGNKVSLEDFKGKKIILNFWATWCPPCRGEMPDIEKYYQKSKDSDVVILAVNIGEEKDKVDSFIKKNNYNFKILLDLSTEVASIYSVNAIPTTYFINEKGEIINMKKGAMTIEDMSSMF